MLFHNTAVSSIAITYIWQIGSPPEHIYPQAPDSLIGVHKHLQWFAYSNGLPLVMNFQSRYPACIAYSSTIAALSSDLVENQNGLIH